ncbi:MAG TPA: magnesium transporter [Acidimicrobiia bacterium]|nr:magnesium transporter [Acidimicrobiia bacterium]
MADYLGANREEWEALAQGSPGDAADIIEQLEEEDAVALLSALPPPQAAEVLEEIAPELAAKLIEQYSLTDLAAALNEMPSEAAADLIGELGDEVTEDVLAAMTDEAEYEVRDLLVFPADSAGGLMTTEIAALPLGLTTDEAIERIRQLREVYEDLCYVYVVDDVGRLQGVLSFRDLVFRRPGAPLADVMVADPVTVTTLTDREEVAELAQRYHLLGIPVTDSVGTLLGMVTTEAVIEAIQDEATEDFAAAVGAGVEETVYSTILRSVRSRSPWLMLNLTLALIVALIVEQLTGVISEFPVLAALMPVVASLGGNTGQQSLAVMVRGLGTDDVPGSQVPSILWRQVRIGVLNGLILAAVAMTIVAMLIVIGVMGDDRSDVLRICLAIGAAVEVNLTIASLAGSGIPLILRRFGLDPALASTIFLTLITDAMGFGGFLVTAAWLL